MTEEFLSYIWFNRLFFEKQTTLLGEEVTVVSTGMPNTDAGADVFNAKVSIDGRVWAGNVEFHVRAGDWHRHGHDGDSEYDKLILHVVLEGDEQILRSDGTPIPTVALAFPAWMADRYRSLVAQTEPMFCLADAVADTIGLHSWMDRLFAERLEEKTEVIKRIVQRTAGNWDEAFYVLLARALGFGVNSDAMQALAESVPLGVIQHHRDHIEQIEALFLGQAGLLAEAMDFDREVRIWRREYDFLRKKFSLPAYQGPAFKFLRMRPYGFPTMRMAQLSAMLHANEHLMRRVVETERLDDLYRLFGCTASGYWRTHFTISPSASPQPHSCSLTRKSIDILIINAVVPFLFHYGRERNDYSLVERAENFMRQLPPEHNSKINPFVSAGLPCENAYDSQAIIRLHRAYCQSRNCLRCYFGRKSLSIPGADVTRFSNR